MMFHVGLMEPPGVVYMTNPPECHPDAHHITEHITSESHSLPLPGVLSEWDSLEHIQYFSGNPQPSLI